MDAASDASVAGIANTAITASTVASDAVNEQQHASMAFYRD